MTKIFKVCFTLLWLRLPLRIDVSRASFPRRPYRISRESFFPCQNIAWLPDLIYPAALANVPDLLLKRFRARYQLPLTQPLFFKFCGNPARLLLQVGGRGLESFCAVHVRCERGEGEEIDPRKGGREAEKGYQSHERCPNEKRLPACVVRVPVSDLPRLSDHLTPSHSRA